MSNWLRQPVSLKNPNFFFLMNFRSVFRKAWTKERKWDLLWINEKIKTSSFCAQVTYPLLIRETHLLIWYCCLCVRVYGVRKTGKGQSKGEDSSSQRPTTSLRHIMTPWAMKPYKKPRARLCVEPHSIQRNAQPASFPRPGHWACRA